MLVVVFVGVLVGVLVGRVVDFLAPTPPTTPLRMGIWPALFPARAYESAVNKSSQERSMLGSALCSCPDCETRGAFINFARNTREWRYEGGITNYVDREVHCKYIDMSAVAQKP
jgi:hypothetical protein